MNRWLGWVIVLALGLGVAPGWARSEVSRAERVELMTPVTLGVRSQESETEGVADVLVPLWRGPQSVLLANLRGAMNDHDEEELNVGLGLRHLVDARHPFIVGGFVFYDGRWTRQHNRFDQLGLSAEVLSDWVDGRINYYLPNHDTALVDRQDTLSTRETRRVVEESATAWGDPYGRVHEIVQDRTTLWTRREITTRETIGQFYENREAALEGWDAEIGVRLPLFERWFETRVFAGYQYFDHPFGGHLKGAQGRIELRAIEGRLLLDAQVFENRELNQSDWRAGVRMRLPFELSALAQGRNPFARTETFGRGDLRSRLDDMVMRDPKIQLQKSGYVEDVSKRTTEKSTRTKEEKRTESATEVLADGVTFVDGDQGDDANPGTAEQPKETIQGGVDGAQASSRLYTMAWPDGRERRLVYVRPASQSYAGVEVAAPGIGLVGSGMPMPGYGGKVFGGGASPRVLSAGAPGVAVQAAAGGMGVTGFEFTGEGLSTGIRSESGELLVWNNDFRDLFHGVFIGTTDPEFDTWVLNNRFERMGESSVQIDAEGDGAGLFRFRAEDNRFADGGSGILGGIIPDFDGENWFEDDWLDWAGTRNYGAGSLLFARNEFANLPRGGLNMAVILAADSGGNLEIEVLNNQFRQCGDNPEQLEGAMEILAGSGRGDVLFRAAGNVVADSAHGLIAWGGSQDGGSIALELSNNRVANGFGLFAIGAGGFAGDGGSVDITLVGNTVRGEDELGVFGMALTDAGAATILAGQNTVEDSAWNGIRLGGWSASGEVTVSALGNTVRNTGEGNGIWLQADAQGDATAVARGNVVADTGGDGLYCNVATLEGVARLEMTGNTSIGNDWTGLCADIWSEDGRVEGEVSGNRSLDNGEDGAWFQLDAGEGDVDFTCTGNTFDNNRYYGLFAGAYSEFGDITADLTGNRASGNTEVGIEFYGITQFGGMMVNADRNTARGNMDGIQVYAISRGEPVTVDLRQNIVENNAGTGIGVNGHSAGGVTINASGNQVINNCRQEGEGVAGMHLRGVSGEGLVKITADGNRAVSNEVCGLLVRAVTEGGDIEVTAARNFAQGNTGEGMEYDGAELPSGGMLFLLSSESGGITADLMGNEAHQNESIGMGLGAYTDSGDITVTANQNAARETTGEGATPDEGAGMSLEMVTESGNIVFAATGNTVEGNAAAGMDFSADSASGDVDITLTENTALGNQKYGIISWSKVTNGTFRYTATENTVEGNTEAGLAVGVTGAGGMDMSLAGNTARGNQGDGLRVGVIYAGDGNVDVELDGNIANGNEGNGICISNFLANATATWTIAGNQANGNDGNGLVFEGRAGTDVTWTATENVLEGNHWGVELRWNPAPGTGDFTFTQNSVDNTGLNFYLDAEFDLNAQENWWGAAPPDNSKFFEQDTGNIDWSNWLTARPDLP